MARHVTVTTIAWNAASGQTPESALAEATTLFRLAAVAKPDLVVFPELFLHGGSVNGLHGKAPALPNTETDHFGRLAREYGTHIALGLPVAADGRMYNSAVMIDRQGDIVGRYDKMYPTLGELEQGVAPGAAPVVHTLDFGRVGHVICYDANFPELATAYRDLDPNLICFHSMFAGGPLLESWALTVGAYLVSAYAEESRVIDMTGVELGRTGNRYEQHNGWKVPPILTVRLNLDRQLFHGDGNYTGIPGHGPLQRLLAERAHQVTVDHNYPASVFALGAREGVTLADLMRQYGLEPRNAYFRRAQQRIATARQM